jgi:manganese/zinc/iron transport system permease protein
MIDGTTHAGGCASFTLAVVRFDAGLDLFPFLAAVLAAVACGVLGNFLVLRRLSLMGDAISHSVLPGLVIAFLVASTRSPLVMLAGAACAGLATVVLVELVKKLGRVEPGAAMGVVFSVLFAIGVLLIERAAVRHVDLDADCVLHGQLETLVWYGAPGAWGEVLSVGTLAYVPRQVWMLAGVCVAAVGFVVVLFKELRIAAFDPALATTQGYSATLLHLMLMLMVAGATVASFEAVGSILVIAMLVCPAATARLLTDRLWTQVAVSVAVAVGASVLGYFGASAIPAVLGKDSVNAAGSIAVASGVLLVVAIVASPSHGVVVRWARRRALTRTIAREDLLAALYRAREAGRVGLAEGEVGAALARMGSASGHASGVVEDARARGLVASGEGGVLALTGKGESVAADVVRKHRLWETYLVGEVGLAPDHVHEAAERLEHGAIRPQAASGGGLVDPHGKRIPPGA